MIKPMRLKKGDTVAIVSLSGGIGGESPVLPRYEIGVKRLEAVFGLHVITMPHALKGMRYLYENPKSRAEDLMAAFKNPEVKAIISMIGGDDTIRLLPFIDFDVIRSNPKIFMGFSDTTGNHMMMHYAGLSSFYGPALLTDFAENVHMLDYTKNYILKTLFEPSGTLDILPSPEWTTEFLDWFKPENNAIARTMTPDAKGYECLQGHGTVQGRLLGGCIEVFPMLMGTKIWPTDWKGKILFLETSEGHIAPKDMMYILRGLAAQDVFDGVVAVICGKPKDEKYYDEYKAVLTKVIGTECGRSDLPILYNLNYGHTSPICILPYDCLAEINCDAKTFRLLEPAVM